MMCYYMSGKSPTFSDFTHSNGTVSQYLLLITISSIQLSTTHATTQGYNYHMTEHTHIPRRPCYVRSVPPTGALHLTALLDLLPLFFFFVKVLSDMTQALFISSDRSPSCYHAPFHSSLNILKPLNAVRTNWNHHSSLFSAQRHSVITVTLGR